jgi:nicotinate-nucleotide adenylyltransferase
VSLVAVFGGSFDPPHVAHVLAAVWVLSTHAPSRLLVVPTFRHPFAKQMAPFDERVHMAKLAMEWLPGVEVSRVEEELGGDGRTLHLLEHLSTKHPDWRLRLVMGADLLIEAPKWHAFDRVVALAPPIVLGRVGFDAPGAPKAILPEISSTLIRRLVREEQWGAVEGLVPKDVLAHLRAHGLYRERHD